VSAFHYYYLSTRNVEQHSPSPSREVQRRGHMPSPFSQAAKSSVGSTCPSHSAPKLRKSSARCIAFNALPSCGSPAQGASPSTHSQAAKSSAGSVNHSLQTRSAESAKRSHPARSRRKACPGFARSKSGTVASLAPCNSLYHAIPPLHQKRVSRGQSPRNPPLEKGDIGGLESLGRNILSQINNAVGIAPLIVIP
jgi:hypothetical protein